MALKGKAFGLLGRVAPRTATGLRDLTSAREEHGSLFDALAYLKTVPATLESQQRQIDELRRDGRHVTELYDLVFERLRADPGALGDSPEK
jgi:hypothetical protein